MNNMIASNTSASTKPRNRRGMAVSTVSRSQFETSSKGALVPVPPLVNGDTLDGPEFLRRYSAMPELKKAQLIDGVVYLMASPVCVTKHGDPDSLMQTWAGTYRIETPGVLSATNATTQLSHGCISQPDGSLRYSVSRGGKTTIGPDDFIHGPPELVFEISGSSASIDVNIKRNDYAKAGVQEYVAWLTEVPALKWWYLEDGQFKLLPEDKDGIQRSRVFPGLWLDAKALLKGDAKRVMATLRKGLRSKEHTAFAKKC